MARTIKRDKRLKKMKKERGWLSTLIIFILVAAVSFLFVIAGTMIVDAFFISEIHEEDEDMKFYVSVYNENEEEAIDLLKRQGRIFFIKDSEGSVILKNGENTCTDNEATLDFEGNGFEDVNACLDGEKNYFEFVGNGGFKVHWFDLISDMKDKNEYVVSVYYDDIEDEKAKEEYVEAITEANMIFMPFWIKLTLADGNTFYGKAYVDFGTTEIVTVMVVGAGLIALLVTLIIMMIIFQLI